MSSCVTFWPQMQNLFAGPPSPFMTSIAKTPALYEFLSLQIIHPISYIPVGSSVKKGIMV